jgi:hypothetical protein
MDKEKKYHPSSSERHNQPTDIDREKKYRPSSSHRDNFESDLVKENIELRKEVEKTDLFK